MTTKLKLRVSLAVVLAVYLSVRLIYALAFNDGRTYARADARAKLPIARLWVEPDDGVQPILQLLESARTEVDVGEYLLTDRAVLKKLLLVYRKGIKVRVIADRHPYLSYTGNRDAIQLLQAADIPWKYGSRAFVYNHEKIILVDRASALVMTSNLTNAAFTTNREYLALVRDRIAVNQLQAIFDADWSRHGLPVHSAALVVSPDNSRGLIASLIASARRTIDLETEVIQDPHIIHLLVAARHRGVKVRLVLTPDLRDPSQIRVLESMAGKGLRVRVLKQPYVHGKVIIADGNRLYIGSVNLSANSLDHNREIGLLTETSFAVQKCMRIFRADWTNGYALYSKSGS